MNFFFRQKDLDTVLGLLLIAIGVLGMVLWGKNSGTYDELGKKTYDFHIDLNHASWSELTLMPGIGEKLAHRIVDYRDSHAPFTSADELARVRGIGPKKVESIRNYLVFDTEHQPKPKNE